MEWWLNVWTCALIFLILMALWADFIFAGDRRKAIRSGIPVDGRMWVRGEDVVRWRDEKCPQIDWKTFPRNFSFYLRAFVSKSPLVNRTRQTSQDLHLPNDFIFANQIIDDFSIIRLISCWDDCWVLSSLIHGIKDESHMFFLPSFVSFMKRSNSSIGNVASVERFDRLFGKSRTILNWRQDIVVHFVQRKPRTIRFSSAILLRIEWPAYTTFPSEKIHQFSKWLSNVCHETPWMEWAVYYYTFQTMNTPIEGNLGEWAGAHYFD